MQERRRTSVNHPTCMLQLFVACDTNRNKSRNVRVSIYMQACIYTYIYICIHMYTQTCTHVSMYLSVYLSSYTYTFTALHSYLYILMYIYILILSGSPREVLSFLELASTGSRSPIPLRRPAGGSQGAVSNWGTSLLQHPLKTHIYIYVQI